MDLSNLQLAIVVGLVFLAGFVDSIAGGGGLISLPAYFAVGLPPHAALATNKFSSFCGTFTAVLRYFNAGKIRLKIGLIAALGALAGSAAGAKAALFVHASVIRTVMLVLAPTVLVFFIVHKKILPPSDGKGGVAHETVKACLIGAVVGLYDGFFGPGTGTFLTIGFHFLLRFDLVTASANARLSNLASNAGALAVFLVNAQVVFPLALYAAAGGIAGNLIGSSLAIQRGERIVRPLLIVVLVLLLAEVVRQQIG
ncbi:MAG: sulfite exporter TauE/SafE family protein [Myxococcales bacterium]|nr:MAG: sulfite exporter TauE/SafE family protein [Myxococcales bacterium]